MVKFLKVAKIKTIVRKIWVSNCPVNTPNVPRFNTFIKNKIEDIPTIIVEIFRTMTMIDFLLNLKIRKNI